VVASEAPAIAIGALKFELKAGVSDAQAVNPRTAAFDNFRVMRQ
jgi:hypothetical protein